MLKFVRQCAFTMGVAAEKVREFIKNTDREFSASDYDILSMLDDGNENRTGVVLEQISKSTM